MTESLKNMLSAGCSRILLNCNTSHLFLPHIYERLPILEEKVIHLIQNCTQEIARQSVKKVYILGSEGTIESGVYQEELAKFGIQSEVPHQSEYHMLRECIESVKQHNYTESVKRLFLKSVNKYDDCILGCTELPILFNKYKDEVSSNIYDPAYMALCRIHNEFNMLLEKNNMQKKLG